MPSAGRRRPIGITPIKRPLQPRSLDAAISSTPAKQARTFAGGGSALASVLGGRANQPLALPDAFDLDGEDSDSALEDVLKIAPVDEVTVEVEASAPYTHMIGTYMAKDVKYVLLVIKAIPPTDGANLSTTIINGDTIEVQTVLPHMGVIEANKISQFFADKGELSDVQALHMQRFILKMCDKQSPTWRYSVKLPFKLDGSRLITIRTYFPVAGTDRADHVLVIHVPEYLEQVTQHNKSIELI